MQEMVGNVSAHKRAFGRAKWAKPRKSDIIFIFACARGRRSKLGTVVEEDLMVKAR